MNINTITFLKNYFIIFVVFILAGGKSMAQLVSGNAFLKDSFVEVAVGPCGNFASTVAAPADYHPRGLAFGRALGFVANPAKNNWASYVGDYFLPGSPEEGFGLTINGTNFNNNQICGANQIPGSIISTESTGLEKSATWQGRISGLTITAKTFIPAGALYFVTKVTITNTSGSPVNNIYYMRNVDPDQGISTPGSTGSYNTFNSVVYQNPNSCNRALVSATPRIGTAEYLGLGSVDPRSRVTKGGFSNRNASAIWNGIGLSTTGTNFYADEAISISFNLGNLAPNASTSFAYAYILNQAELEQALVATNVGLSIAGISVNIGNTNDICAGTAIPVSLSNTGTYTSWTWSPATGLDTTRGTLVHATVSSPTVYTATGTGVCGSVSLTVSLTPVIIIPPGSAGPISGPTTVPVGETNLVYSIEPLPNATSYEWQIPPGSTINSSPDSNSITISTSNNAWCGEIIVTPKNACGNGTPSSLYVCIDGDFSITLDTPAVRVCPGASPAKLYYDAVGGSPNLYSVVWSAAANTAGFVNVSNAPLPASPILLQVPAALDSGTYTGSLTVGDGIFNSVGYPIRVTIISPVIKDTTLAGCNRFVYKGVTYTSSIIKKDTVKSYLGCDSIYNIANIIITIDSSIFSAARPLLTNTGRLLKASISSIYKKYQWFRNGVIIAGADTSYYYAPLSGSYTVAFINNCGESPRSNPVVFSANSRPQTIVFPAIPTKFYTDPPFVLRATASSLLPVSYTVLSGPGQLINDTTIAITGVGSIEVQATQPGSSVYDTAVPVTRFITVLKGSQTITFPVPDTISGASSIVLTATASSGLPVEYSVLSGPGYVSGNTLYLTGVGLITVRASQPGNELYNAAVSKDVAFCISASQPGLITGSTEVCVNSRANYSVANIDGANFAWSVNGGGVITQSGNTASVQWNTVGTHTVSVRYTTNCGAAGTARLLPVVVTTKTISGGFTRMLPADGSINVAFPIIFSWFPVTNAVSYDIYIWPEAAVKPATPIISNITTISYALFNSSLLEYGKTYKWQLVAKSVCDQLASPVQTFTLRHLPDLIVNNIQVPAGGFSGQSISIRWEVRNIGQGATLNQQWVDRVYLSKDGVVDGADINLGTANNVSALASNTSYVRTASFTLPQGISDNYYAIIVTDAYNQLNELNETNNTTVSTARSAIQLTPPPDLQVTSIVPPNFAFSGQDINVTWRIDNLGTGPTVAASWTDYVYLSADASLNIATATRIGIFNHTGALPVNGSYAQSRTFRLPEGIFGPYYIHVSTDVYNQVYEHAQEANNSRSSDSIHVILTPPIDLVVTQVTAPANASNRQSVPINWRVENQGGSSTESRRWTDNVYFSKIATFNLDSSTLLGSLFHSGAITPGEGYDAAINVLIPRNVTGPYYIYVKTDAGNTVYEYIYENNNTRRSVQAISIASPDLVVSNVVAPSPDTSGHIVNIEWTVKNNGAGTLFTTQVTDRIMLSSGSTYNAVNITELRQFTYNTGELAAGATLTKQASVTLPNGISGNYFIYVHTDYPENIYESSDVNNISRSSSSFGVTLGPWPDLQVLTIQSQDSATAGEVIPLSYRVVNRGIKAVDDPKWTDKIYLSKKATWDSANSVFVREAIQNRFVAKDSSYTINTSIKIPFDFGDTTYYVYVFADANNNIYEHTAEGNNVKRGSAMYVKKYPPVDLAVTSISAPDSGSTGAPILVSWTVMNKGEAATLPGQWTDALYLSTDTLWDGSDQFVKAFAHTGNLVPASSYTNQQSFVLPNGLAGTFYLLLVTDHANVNNDADISNNYKLIKQAGGTGDNDPIPIVIVLTSPPDLVVTSLVIPDLGTAGQPVEVKWIIKNNGPGATAVNNWTEKVYLSTDISFDVSDRLIGTYAHAGKLNPGEQYTDTLQAFLPIEFEGNYVLIFRGDANDNVYEHGAEDNTAIAPITVIKAPLSDLVVTDIQAPEMAMAGETVTFNWTLRNIGANPARGYMQEGVYLSEDTVRDINDIFLGSPPQTINLGPETSINRSFVAELKGVSLRDYHVLIHTDILNNISESNDSNNIAASVQTMQVTVPELPINVLTLRTLPENKEVYYRIEVPDSLTGESLLISLKGDSLRGANEIYLRFGEVPTRAVYDFSHSQPYQGHQEIIVPELKAGTYYLMVYGNTSAETVQSISLLATILNFEIRMVDANKGGNTGQVTLQITGAKLGAVTSIRLDGAGIVEADSIQIANPTKIFATFNLAGASLGLYDVVAENGSGDTTALKNGFTIVQGLAANLVTNVVTPPNTRPSSIISITVQFTNAGNTDLVNPVLKLSSLGGAPIGFNVADLANNTKELTLVLQELNGPVGILRPGANGTVVVYAKATTVLGFTLFQSYE